MLIWSVIFPGIALVTFNDACTFHAHTTKRTLELALVLFAVPFLVALMLGLRKNLEDGWQVGWWPTLPINDWSVADASAAAEFTANQTLQAERSRSIQNHMDTQSVLVQCLALIQTNIILLLKSVYNYLRDPNTAMILQLQVERRDVGADDYLQTLTPEEKRQIHEARESKRMGEKERRNMATSGAQYADKGVNIVFKSALK
jgi:hypothetical protein